MRAALKGANEPLTGRPGRTGSITRNRVRRVLKTPHVVEEEDAWRIVRMDSRRTSSRSFSSEREAVRHAGRTCCRKGDSVFVHLKDGRVRTVEPGHCTKSK